eukprot:scaffold4394_cov113-Isochrysis_galbana.AAC.22
MALLASSAYEPDLPDGAAGLVTQLPATPRRVRRGSTRTPARRGCSRTPSPALIPLARRCSTSKAGSLRQRSTGWSASLAASRKIPATSCSSSRRTVPARARLTSAPCCSGAHADLLCPAPRRRTDMRHGPLHCAPPLPSPNPANVDSGPATAFKSQRKSLPACTARLPLLKTKSRWAGLPGRPVAIGPRLAPTTVLLIADRGVTGALENGGSLLRVELGQDAALAFGPSFWQRLRREYGSARFVRALRTRARPIATDLVAPPDSGLKPPPRRRHPE